MTETEAVQTVADSVEYRPCHLSEDYRVGSDGSIWTRKVRGSKFGKVGSWWKMSSPPAGKGYLHINVRVAGKTIHFQVHTLVATAFHGPPPEGMECRHLNGNPADNRIENLAWGTRQENAADCNRHGRTARGDRNGRRRLNETQVREIHDLLEQGLSHGEIADRYGVAGTTISSIAAGYSWMHLGWVNPRRKE
jgi:hypothetical protein